MNNRFFFQPSVTAVGRQSPMVTMQTFIVTFALVASVFTCVVFNYWPFAFLLVLIGSSFCLLGGYTVGMMRPARLVPPPASSLPFNLVVCLFAVLGLVALWYDRTSIRGIDYIGNGIAAARSDLNSAGERGGVVSIFGNFFSVIVYLPLINLVFDWERWSRGRMVVAICVVLCLAGLIYLTAGRTVVLIAMALVASAMLGRGVLGQPRMPSFLTPGRLVVAVVAILFLFGWIFALRASTFGSASSAAYLSDLCFHLSQPTLQILSQCPSIIANDDSGMIGNIVNYGTAVLLYAFHVAWVGDVIIFDTNPGLWTSFEGAANLVFGRFGFTAQATDYDGYFIPAASGLIYDQGYLSMIVGFVALGLGLAVTQRLLQGGHLCVGRFGFCVFGAIIFLSVLISSANLPFLVLSIIASVGAMMVQRVCVALFSVLSPQNLSIRVK